jgi:hypothetical protein
MQFSKLPKVEQSDCSFCEASGVAVCSWGSKSICYECVYLSNQVAGSVPMGAVYCFACRSYVGFKVAYSTGSVSYLFSGLDSCHKVIYTITEVTGNWHTDLAPLKITCGCCEASIPLWMTKYTSYFGGR